jgi:hypothetical protein
VAEEMAVAHEEVIQVEASTANARSQRRLVQEELYKNEAVKPQQLLNDEQYNMKTVFNAATA